MTLDEATETIGCSDGHVKDLARDGRIRGTCRRVTIVERRRIHGRVRAVAVTRTVWEFHGPSVRAYAKARG